MTRRILGLAAVLAVTTAPVAALADDRTPIRWGVTVSQSLAQMIAPMLELDEEIQERHGIAFETVDFQGNIQACMALAISGEVDVCQTGPTIGMNAIAQGADLRGIMMMIGQTTEFVMSTATIDRLGVSPDAPLEDRIRVMEGLTIAGPGPGTSMHMLTENLKSRVGLSVEDMTYQPLTDLAAMNASIGRGRIDMATWSLGGMSPSLNDGSAQVWISLARGDVPDLATLPNVASFGRTAWIEENREPLQRVQAALVDVLDALRADPVGYGAAFKARYLEAMDPAVWENDLVATLPAFIDDMEGRCEDWDFWVDRLTITDAGNAELARCEVAFVKLR